MPIWREEIKRLAEPTPKEIIRTRPAPGGRGELSYITARDVMDRFDEAVGPENWQVRYHEHLGRTICEIGVYVAFDDGAEWVWKADGAGDTNIEGEKGGQSDALKRASVLWGFHRDLYPSKAENKPKPAAKASKAEPPSDAARALLTLKNEAAAQAEHFGLEPAQGKFVLISAMAAAGIKDVDGGNFPARLIAALEADAAMEVAVKASIGLWVPDEQADDAFGGAV